MKSTLPAQRGQVACGFVFLHATPSTIMPRAHVQNQGATARPAASPAAPYSLRPKLSPWAEVMTVKRAINNAVEPIIAHVGQRHLLTALLS